MKEDQFKFECEARFWIKYEMKNVKSSWTDKKNKLIRRRGQASVDKLIKEMNRQRVK